MFHILQLAGQFLIRDEVRGYECRIFKGGAPLLDRAATALRRRCAATTRRLAQPRRILRLVLCYDVSDEELLCVMSIEKRLFSSHHHSYMDGGHFCLCTLGHFNFHDMYMTVLLLTWN